MPGRLGLWLGIVARGPRPEVAVDGHRLHTTGWWAGLFGWTVGVVRADIPVALLGELPIHSRLTVGERTARYAVIPSTWTNHAPRRRQPLRVRSLRSTVIVRQNIRNGVVLTVRETQPLDSMTRRLLVLLAFIVAQVRGRSEGVLLYEKHSNRYEESAAAFFEYLHERGDTGARFVLARNSRDWQRVPQHLRRFVLAKHSFRHYVEYFRHVNFWGTEVPDHAMDLRNASRVARWWAVSRHLRFVFLQHGVMLMISLGSDNRADMRQGHPSRPAHTRIVASSEVEAHHFVSDGGYRREDVLVTGLPKFDLARHADAANLVTIMPTWRPWDYNLARVAPERTTYAAFLRRVLETVPAEMLPNVRIATHPHMQNVVELPEFAPYLSSCAQLDELLIRTGLLVTDYSSIAFDAFHRGAGVIFAWQEIDECLERYGGILTLTEGLAFGPVTRTWADLAATLRAPSAWRSEAHESKFTQLVAFHDGRNRERLYDALREGNEPRPDERQ
ncbi:CDP-glycerol glycerophosphotransferase family protein [Micrococcales bacterium 31B]|nr:CDP-glycerol glycerophosphotransferase family protein [Micrococcales bacterium 31B]